ncbi:MAG: aldo/keto reductase [Alphaproteobacteria bacterium]|nr:aldo/keto reductase [Alphaproteobacteria bacterium]
MHKTIDVRNTQIPRIGLGTWQMQGITCVEAVSKALDLGYRYIDTAQIYENESDVGEAISSSDVPRSDIFLTTKIWMDKVGPETAQKSVETSLKKLKTEYVDLLLLHWPVGSVPLDQQVKSLQAIQKAGLTKMIGVSNYTVDLMKQVTDDLGADIITNQVEYHPYLSQAPVLDFVRQHDMFLTAYCPLARGRIRAEPLLTELGKKYDKSAGQVTLRWLIQQKQVVAIPKAANPLHIEDNFNIFDFSLTADEMSQISALAKPDGRIVNPEWAPEWDKENNKSQAA